jgi:CSLREA domain-containing protein
MLRKAIVMALLMLAALPATAMSKTFAVETTDDGVDPQPDDQCLVPPHDICTLRAAVDSANATPGDDIITLPAGTYKLTITGAGEDNDATGDLDVKESVTVQGAGADQTFIDGNATDRIFDVPSGAHTLSLENLTLQHGQTAVAAGGGAVRDHGKGLSLTDVTVTANTGSNILETFGPAGSSVSLTRTTVTANTTTTFFPAVLDNSSAQLTITDSSMSSNQVPNGGHLIDDDPSGEPGNHVTITGSHFNGNTIGGASSGGVLFEMDPSGPITAATLAVTDSEFNDNTLGSGSNLFFFDPSNGGSAGVAVDAQFTHVLMAGNHVADQTGQSADGGLIRWQPGADAGQAQTLAITNSTFRDNTLAHDFGRGAIEFRPDHPSQLNITGSTFAGNTVGAANGTGSQGGALYVASGSANIVNSTFSGNAAAAPGFDSGGGAIFVTDTGQVGLQNVTIAGNSTGRANGGGGIFNETDVDDLRFGAANVAPALPGIQVTSSIVAGNSASGAANDCAGTLPISGGTNLEGATSCHFTGAGDLQSKDPKLAALADNGGPTPTRALIEGSPAIDGAGTACPATDQRGVARPNGPACDIGAFEGSSPAPQQQPPPSGGTTTTPPSTTPPATTPPVAATSKPPAKLPAFSSFVTLPSARSCVSRRHFRIRLRIPKGVAVREARVFVNNKRVAVRKGKRLTAPVDLRGLPKGRFTVKIQILVADGRIVSGQRRYKTCAKKQHGGKPHV